MKKLLALSLIAFACSGAQAVELFNNGTVINQAPNLSVLPVTDSTLGSASSTALGFALADNFSVGGAGWNVQSLDFYGYQTSAVGFTFTGATWSIVSGTNVNTGAVVASGTTPVTNAGLVAFRVTTTTLTSTARAVFKMNADIPDLVLPAGNYFLTWALTGSSTSGPFVPPVGGASGSGNALQGPVGGTTFAAVTDGLSLQPFDVPFAIQGTVIAIPEPTSLALMLAGGLGVAGLARRRRMAA
jgi:hypothetical protein